MSKYTIFLTAFLSINIALAQQCPEDTITSRSLNGETECIPKSIIKSKNTEHSKDKVATWEFSKFKLGSEFNLECAANFKDAQGGIVLAVSKNRNLPGLFILYKNEISKPDQSHSHEILATLKEDAEPSSTVKALVTQTSNTKYVIFAVSTSTALIQAIKDSSRVTVSVQHDSPFTVSYHDGSIAKKGLSQCISND